MGGLCTSVLFSIAALFEVQHTLLQDAISEAIIDVEDGTEIRSSIFQNQENLEEESLVSIYSSRDEMNSCIVMSNLDINNSIVISNDIISEEIIDNMECYSNQVQQQHQYEEKVQEQQRSFVMKVDSMVNISPRYIMKSKSILDTLSFIELYNSNQ